MRTKEEKLKEAVTEWKESFFNSKAQISKNREEWDEERKKILQDKESHSRSLEKKIEVLRGEH